MVNWLLKTFPQQQILMSDKRWRWNKLSPTRATRRRKIYFFPVAIREEKKYVAPSATGLYFNACKCCIHLPFGSLFIVLLSRNSFAMHHSICLEQNKEFSPGAGLLNMFVIFFFLKATFWSMFHLSLQFYSVMLSVFTMQIQWDFVRVSSFLNEQKGDGLSFPL